MPRETLDALRAQLQRERDSHLLEVNGYRQQVEATRLENARLRAVMSVLRSALNQAEQDHFAEKLRAQEAEADG